MRAAALASGLALALFLLPAAARDATPLTCKTLAAVDGDTVRCDGVLLRDMGDGEPFVSGYDTPEIRKPKCAAEKALGEKAKRRMRQLLKTPGLRILDSGRTDRRYGRPLVWIVLPDGRSIGGILIAEGLAARWTPDYRPSWCGQRASLPMSSMPSSSA